MAIEVNLETVASGYNLSKINANFQEINTGLQAGLSRNGAEPNYMETDFDLNSNDLLNGGAGAFTSLTIDGTDIHDVVGAPGPEGPQGPPGADGANGTNGTNGLITSIVAGTNITVDNTTPSAPIINATGGGVTDGDKGDIIVASSGASWTFDTSVVTAAAKTVLDDASTAAMLTTLGAQPVDADLTSWAAVTRAAGVDTFVTTPTSANLRALLTDEVGTGAAYFVGGALDTPASVTLTNATGLPISTGVSGLGTGVATFLATPSSANLRSALTDESGTGNAYFQGGNLGTPSAGVLTNATGTAASLTAGTATVANGLKTATTTVVVSAATAPNNGDVLTASSSTAASWVAPSSGGTAATQSDQETATSTTTFVSPGRQQYHPSAAKVFATATSTGTLTTSYNVASRTDNGTGDITFTFTTSFSATTYAHFCQAGPGSAPSSNAGMTLTYQTTKAVGSTRWVHTDQSTGGGSLLDPVGTWHYVAFGDQ